jgi:hypothetical protein
MQGGRGEGRPTPTASRKAATRRTLHLTICLKGMEELLILGTLPGFRTLASL